MINARAIEAFQRFKHDMTMLGLPLPIAMVYTPEDMDRLCVALLKDADTMQTGMCGGCIESKVNGIEIRVERK